MGSKGAMKGRGATGDSKWIRMFLLVMMSTESELRKFLTARASGASVGLGFNNVLNLYKHLWFSIILSGVVCEDLLYTIRAGDDVTLSCENVIKGNRNCNTTTWNYNKLGRAAQELVDHGQVKYSRSDPLSLAGNCSLVLRNISAEDAGLYTCRQYEIEGGSTSRRDAPVYLSVVTLREQTEQNKVTFTCSVSPYDECRRKVKWLFKGNDVEKDHPDIKTSSPSSCSAAVTFQTSTYVYSSRFKLFICEVETENKQQLFTFSSGPTGGKTDTTESAGGSPPTPGPSCTAVWLRFLIGSVGLAALTAGVVVTSRRTRAKGRKTQTDSGMVCDDGADGAADYENIRTSSV
nr:uncharacterized protein LOC129165455 [Nothobranchius furzeri]